MRVAELEGAALDWAAGSCENPNSNFAWPYGKVTWSPLWKCYTIPDLNNAALRLEWHPSIDWSQGGPIIEREGMSLWRKQAGMWLAAMTTPYVRAFGPTPLIAAMRCYVASKLGDTREKRDAA